jgi:hypothetical protein
MGDHMKGHILDMIPDHQNLPCNSRAMKNLLKQHHIDLCRLSAAVGASSNLTKFQNDKTKGRYFVDFDAADLHPVYASAE